MKMIVCCAIHCVASRRLAFIEHPESPGRNSPESRESRGLACSLSSEFGTQLTTTDAVQRYIVQRAATFFQAVLVGIDHQLPLDIFYQWPNNRIKSNINVTPDPDDCDPACNQPCPNSSSGFTGADED